MVLLFILLAAAYAGARLYLQDIPVSEKEEPPVLEREQDLGDLTMLNFDKHVSLDVDFLSRDRLRSKIIVNDLAIGGVTISAQVFLKGCFIPDKQSNKSIFSGKLFSKNITLNSDPFVNLSMSFEIRDGSLKIKSLKLGRSYKLRGSISLAGPFETKLRLVISRADIRDIALIARVKDPNIAVGIINGFVDINGPLQNPLLNGMLQSRNGRIGPVEYTSANVRFEGLGPILNIVDSALRHGSGTFTVEGFIDLRNIAEGRVFNGLKVKSDMKAVVWKDWDINKNGTDELSMTKQISDKIKVGFKTVARDPDPTFYERENPEEMKLEYKLGEENLKLKLKENEEFFGIEHNVKF